MHPHLRSKSRHRCPLQKKLLGQQFLHASPKSGNWLPLGPDGPPAAFKCRPIKAHALSVSARTKSLKSTAFVRTKGSCMMRQKKLAMRPILFRNIPDARRCAQTQTLDVVRNMPDSFSIGPFPHLSKKIAPTTTKMATANCETKCQPEYAISKHSSAFANAATGSLRCSSHNSRRVLCSAQNIFFASWTIKFLMLVPCPFNCRKGCRFFDAHSAFWLQPPGSTLCLSIRLLQFLCKWLDKMRASPHRQVGVPTAQVPMCFVLMKARCMPNSSVRSVNSSAASLMIALEKASLNFCYWTRIDMVPRRKPLTSTELRLSTAMKFLSRP